MPNTFKNLLQFTGSQLLKEPPKRVVLSGPSGFLGQRVLKSVLQVHEFRRQNNLNPGEIVLLSASPGKLMKSLLKKFGPSAMSTVRASRVDYYTQHDIEVWVDSLGSLGLEGENCVFVNLAAVAGPDGGRNGLALVNYNAPVAAAKACQKLGFGHWIQSSSQATNAERASQVRYSRGKAMADYALSRLESLPVTILCLGLLYCKTDGMVGQDQKKGLNLIDLSLLPLTPVMGNGTAPLQPLEVNDASDRLAYLALTDPSLRPLQKSRYSKVRITVDYSTTGTINDNTHNDINASIISIGTDDTQLDKDTSYDGTDRVSMIMGGDVYTKKIPVPSTFRRYDAVGPETITMLQLLQRFAKYQGRKNFRKVHIGYDNMERLLNITSLGNMNRQFLSLLRSEQESDAPVIGDPRTFAKLLGPEAKLTTLDEAFATRYEQQLSKGIPPRKFPYGFTAHLICTNPRVIFPGILLSLEIISCYFQQFKLYGIGFVGENKHSIPNTVISVTTPISVTTTVNSPIHASTPPIINSATSSSTPSSSSLSASSSPATSSTSPLTAEATTVSQHNSSSPLSSTSGTDSTIK